MSISVVKDEAVLANNHSVQFACAAYALEASYAATVLLVP